MWSESCRVLNPVTGILESKKNDVIVEKAERKSLRNRIIDFFKAK